MAPNGHNLYPVQYYPSPVPQYAPRVTTQVSTPVIHTQCRSSGTPCTSNSSKTLQHCSFWVCLLLGSLIPPYVVINSALAARAVCLPLCSWSGPWHWPHLFFGRERPYSPLGFCCSTTVCLPSSAGLLVHGLLFLPLCFWVCCLESIVSTRG